MSYHPTRGLHPFDPDTSKEPVHDPITNPIADLQAKLRRDQDRHATLLIQARALAQRHAEIRDEAAELDAAIRATRGLLTLADSATRSATETTTDTPAKPAKKGTRRP